MPKVFGLCMSPLVIKIMTCENSTPLHLVSHNKDKKAFAFTKICSTYAYCKLDFFAALIIAPLCRRTHSPMMTGTNIIYSLSFIVMTGNKAFHLKSLQCNTKVVLPYFSSPFRLNHHHSCGRFRFRCGVSQ